jgi:cobalt-zinc-cadmium efflux system membrane fusion protein
MKGKKRLLLIVLAIAGVFLTAVATWNLVQACSADGQFKKVGESQENGEQREDKESEKVIRLSDKDMEGFGIGLETAGPGKLDVLSSFPAEIVVNSDRTAQIVPRLTGVVSEVRKNLGDSVTAGEVMAVIESRELAEAKAKYLAAISRMNLAQTNFTKYEGLWQKEAIAEKQFLEVKNAFEEAQIELRSAKQKLHAMGLSSEYLKNLSNHPDEALPRYEMLAPFGGTVISKRITLGEMRKEDHEAFVISDLSSLWVNLSVSQKELTHVKEGQTVIVSSGNGIPDSEGTIAYLEPVIGDKTRSAIARVVLPNPDKKWRPGLFVTAKVTVDSVDAPVVVSKTAVQKIEGKTVIFVREGEGFESKSVKLGRVNGSHVEIVAGISPGDQYAAKQTFLLKAELGKSEAHDND